MNCHRPRPPANNPNPLFTHPLFPPYLRPPVIRKTQSASNTHTHTHTHLLQKKKKKKLICFLHFWLANPLSFSLAPLSQQQVFFILLAALLAGVLSALPRPRSSPHRAMKAA
ncbi:hypothetical protein QBC44DRAFT_6678 [Cladorrhinum sp. PSN332]|nr:hypothetical protein QBC44DRAFT_6678 [Cladorrhinum sp. PSN332]